MRLPIVLVRQMAGYPAISDKKPGVIPGFHQNRRDIERCMLVARGRKRAARGEGSELLGIELLDASEPAKLAFHAVEKAMMVRVRRDEAITAHVIVGLHPLDHVNREGQARDPRCASGFVSK